jgi:hypothetical protein
MRASCRVVETLKRYRVKARKPRPALTLLTAALVAFSAYAQPLSNLVFTVGTTIQEPSLNNWSYVLLGAPEAQLLSGKRFAVYGKNGLPTDVGTFTMRATLFQQTDTGAINTLLNQSVALGDDLTSLDNALNVLLHKVPGAAGQTLPQKVLTAFQTAASDSGVASALLILEGLHPGLTRCAGHAFAETITTTTTYEVREVNQDTGIAGDVIGRVTITPGAPVVLPAPGFPFQIVTNAPSDHLRVRLRWGTPAALRRLSLLQFGFNVWRIPLVAAQAGNFNVTPPSLAQLYSNTNFTRINTLPVMATKDYAPLAGPGGPDDATDLTTFFFSDSNGRSPGSAQFPPGQTPPGYLATPFNDGDQFYYFITARDILGRDGLVSPGGLAIACRRNLPSAPTKLNMLNSVQVVPLGGGFTNQPHLVLRWLQNTNMSDVVTQYWVYRWPNPAMALTNDITPSNNVVGVVSQLANTNYNYLLDTDPTAPATPGPSNFWYTVRAVSQSACGSLLFSPNSAPASGVLRQHAAPQATTGELIGSCGTPGVMFQQFDSIVNPNGPDTNNWNYRVTVTRRDAGIAWAQLFVGNYYLQNTQAFGPLYFPPDANSLSVDVALPAASANSEFDVRCQVGTYYGIVSQTAICQTTNTPSPSQITEAVFQAGELLFTALRSSDPFLQVVNLNQSSCLPAINPTRDPSGTVHMRFDVGAGVPMMIQYATNLNAVQFWTDVGIATPDTNGVYSIYLCPCVISPLPPLRGCTVNLPNDGVCDQHAPRAGNSGPIAPIQVRFRLTPRTHEYRLYRSVNGAAPTLVAQGEAPYDSLNPNNEIVRTDDAMPPSAARLCYFVQVLDENGNGSPLALIGCKDSVPPKPPTPVLSQPAPAGDTGNPQVALSWFCPTAGVYRFEIRIQRVDQSGSGKPTGFANLQLIKLSVFKPLLALGPNPSPRFYGLTRSRSLVSLYDEWQLTPPIGPSFGPGPQFTLTASVVPNVPYRISVAAEDIQGDWGDASTEWDFVWQPPPTFQTVPWPARPLPPVTLFDEPAAVPQPSPAIYSPRVAAVMFTNTDGTLADAHYPVGIRFAVIFGASQLVYNVGNTNLASYFFSGTHGSFADPGIDPNSGVFKRYSSGNGTLQNGQPLLPIVVYRKQETNGAFPRVSGNLAQVTPLLEQVPWTTYGSPFNLKGVIIPDRLIALGAETFGIIGDRGNFYSVNFLYLRDQQPVILGARYHYYVVRLSDQREVSEVIDAGAVEIPSQ